jgi:hypothetical protein
VSALEYQHIPALAAGMPAGVKVGGRWLLAAGRWPLAAGCCLLPAACCLLPAACCTCWLLAAVPAGWLYHGPRDQPAAPAAAFCR